MSDLPIFFQLALASFVIALVFSVIWVYLTPEKPPTPSASHEDEEDRETIDHHTIKQRRQAQERLFAHLEQSKHARHQRQALNEQPYTTERLPNDQPIVTLYALFDQDQDVYRALVYLQAEALAPTRDQFDHYWAIPDQAYWAWQGDNILEAYGENTLKEMMRERYAQMKAVLLVSGWTLLRETQTDFNLISCYERAR